MSHDGGLRATFRKHLPAPAWLWTSVESRGTASGIPDSHWAHAPSRTSGWVEYKQTDGWAVGLRPHQVAWHTRHAAAGVRCFIAVLAQGRGSSDGYKFSLWLVHGSGAADLASSGLKSLSNQYLLGKFHGTPSQWDWLCIGDLLCTHQML